MCEKCTPEANAEVILYFVTASRALDTAGMIELAALAGITITSTGTKENKGLSFSRGGNVTLHYTITNDGHGLLETFN